MGHELQWQTLLSVLRRQIRQTWLPKRARAFSALPCFFTSIKIKRLDGALTPGYPELPLPLDQFILAPVPRGAVRLVPMEGIRWRWGSLHCTELSCVRTCVSAMLHSCCPAPPRAARDLRCHVGSSARHAGQGFGRPCGIRRGADRSKRAALQLASCSRRRAEAKRPRARSPLPRGRKEGDHMIPTRPPRLLLRFAPITQA